MLPPLAEANSDVVLEDENAKKEAKYRWRNGRFSAANAIMQLRIRARNKLVLETMGTEEGFD